MPLDPVVIVSLARTPLGAFQGILSSVAAPHLGSVALKACVERSAIDPKLIEELLMGCVLPAGLGQAPARQAALQANLALSTSCTTISKVCGSGMKAVMLASDGISAHSYDVALAGGMESMSNAPYLLSKVRGGYRLGHSQLIDHMFLDGLEDAYQNRGRLMGNFAEDCAAIYGFSREEQDAFAVLSTTRAQKASQDGSFQWEIAPVTIAGSKGDLLVDRDESPFSINVAKIPELRPAFEKTGTVTAANSSSISDGAAALLMMRESYANKLKLQPLARIEGYVSYAHTPAQFPTAPIGAIQKLQMKTGWLTKHIDLFEINEAFAVVAMAAIRDLDLPIEKVNVHGGACALGHPIGASGARIIVTLIGALKKNRMKRGVASLCIGGGEATAIAIEMY
jgi:acetyl-CoA C-acetyltransferase